MGWQYKEFGLAQVKFYSDIILFVAFIFINIPQTTGIPFHEWFSIFFIAPMMLHILLDWKWIVNVTKRIFKKLPGEVRFNHLWDTLIYVMMVLAFFTGFVISESALPTLGIHVKIDSFWSAMHDIVANLLMVFIGVHLAMHWGWIVNAVRRGVLSRKNGNESLRE